MSTEGIEQYLVDKNINEGVGTAITAAAKVRASAAYEFIAGALVEQGTIGVPGLADALKGLGEVRGDKVDYLIKKLKAGGKGTSKPVANRSGQMFDAHCHYLNFAQAAHAPSGPKPFPSRNLNGAGCAARARAARLMRIAAGACAQAASEPRPPHASGFVLSPRPVAQPVRGSNSHSPSPPSARQESEGMDKLVEAMDMHGVGHAALTGCPLKKSWIAQVSNAQAHARTHVHTYTRTHVHTYTRTHAHTYTRTRTIDLC